MATYKLSEQNLLIVMNHLPSYGLDVIQVSSETIDGQLEYTVELNGDIPESEIYHFNTGGQTLEIL
jgi:hypothetical protein